MTKSPLKTRFCPSPTGYMHLGNARTALFNTLLARQHQSIFLLRIEDTDKERSREEYTKALLDDLRWLQLVWQEGPEVGGDQGPYWQSQRQAIYDHYYQQLEEQGHAYPCFCSEEDLAITRRIQRAGGKPPRYPGTCAALTKEEVQKKIEQGLKATLRFHVPNDAVIEFQDLVKGRQRFLGQDIGDFIIRRTDGTAPFMYCNAIDDSLMDVTYALRGEDHLTNTPRQILILQALKLSVPHYGHISLIVGADGAPLSKRNGSQSIRELREQGYFSEAIVNYLARLGHYYEDEHFMQLDELASRFRLEHLGRAPARFDSNQLTYWQQEAVLHKNESALWEWMGQAVHAIVPHNQKEFFVTTIKPNVLFPKDAEKWGSIFYTDKINFNEEQRNILKKAGTSFFDTVIETLLSQGSDFRVINNTLKEKLNVKGAALFQPLRVALTGELHGPDMGGIFQLLGVDRIIERLEKAKPV